MGQASETFGKAVPGARIRVRRRRTSVCVRSRCRAEVSYAKRRNTLGGAAPTD